MAIIDLSGVKPDGHEPTKAHLGGLLARATAVRIRNVEPERGRGPKALELPPGAPARPQWATYAAPPSPAEILRRHV